MTALMADDDEGFTMEVRNASPAHLLMKIESFSLLSKHGMDKYESTEFVAGGYKWRLVIHSNGPIKSENYEDDHISVYLTIIETSSWPVGWEINANFTIFLYNQILDNYLCFQGKTRRFHAMRLRWGFSKLISKGSLRAPDNGFLVDDNCAIGAEVAVIKPQRVTQCISVKEFSTPFRRAWKFSQFSKFQDYWKSEEFTFGDHKWYIELYPNGDSHEKGQSVSMYLNIVGANSFASHKKLKADFYLRIKNQLNDQHHSLHTSKWFTSSQPGWGYSAFIPLSDMRNSNKGFLVKDCCIVEVELRVEAVIHDASSTDTSGRGVQKPTETMGRGVKENRK